VLGAINIILALLIIILKETSVFHLSLTLPHVLLSPISGAFVAGIMFPFLRTTVSVTIKAAVVDRLGSRSSNACLVV